MSIFILENKLIRDQENFFFLGTLFRVSIPLGQRGDQRKLAEGTATRYVLDGFRRGLPSPEVRATHDSPSVMGAIKTECR